MDKRIILKLSIINCQLSIGAIALAQALYFPRKS